VVAHRRVIDDWNSSKWQAVTLVSASFKKDKSMLSTILLILLIALLIGALPSWPYSRGWGYYPSGIFSILLIVVVVLLLSGRI
jgi:hypothetical protein